MNKRAGQVSELDKRRGKEKNRGAKKELAEKTRQTVDK